MKDKKVRDLMEKLATCVIELPPLAVPELKCDEDRADCGLERAVSLAPRRWVAGRG